MSSWDSCRFGGYLFRRERLLLVKVPRRRLCPHLASGREPLISRTRTSLPTRSKIYHRPLAVCASARPGAFGAEESAKCALCGRGLCRADGTWTGAGADLPRAAGGAAPPVRPAASSAPGGGARELLLLDGGGQFRIAGAEGTHESATPRSAQPQPPRTMGSILVPMRPGLAGIRRPRALMAWRPNYR
jgi:hypothetical protein